jgi:hypothetical protein
MQIMRHRLPIILFILITQTARAQVLTGSLFGSVKDGSGAVLPLAKVKILSPVLFSGVMITPMNDRGQFRFPELPPGSYSIEIESPGFASYRETEIRIEVGASVERNVVLPVSSISESITVTTSASSLDARRIGVSNQFGVGELRSVPVRRYSMFDFIKAAPGVSASSASSGTNNSVSAFGGGVNENVFLLDGNNFTCPCSGGAAPQPDVDVIEEVQVQSVGAPAEYGNTQAAVFNIVTKQGSNNFRYDASYYGQGDGLTSHPVALFCPNCSLQQTRYARDMYRDFTTHLGGPIVRDRVWFYGGYQYLRDYDSQPGTDPKFPRTDKYDKIFWKLTAQITSKLKLMHSFHDEFWVSPERPTLSKPFDTTVRTSGSRPTSTLAQLSYVVSNKTLVDAQVSRFVGPQESLPSSGDRTTPNHVEQTTGLWSGGPQSFGDFKIARTAIKGSLSHYISNVLSTDHEIKAGFQYEDGRHETYSAMPGGVRYTDIGSQPFQAIFRAPSTTGGQFRTSGIFLDDSIRLFSRLTLNPGVRFDHSRAFSPDLAARDALGNKTSTTIPGLGTLYTWNVVSPRVGAAFKITSDGKTVVRTSYSRFFQGILTGELAPIHPGMTPITDARFDATTGQYSRIVSITYPQTNIAIDSHTRDPYTNQYSLSIDREFPSRLAASIAYVRKDGHDVISWTDTGGVYAPRTTTLPNGQVLPVLALVNSTADRRFLLTNPDGYFLKYNGMTITLRKIQSRRWSLMSSYTFSKAEGLEPSSNGPAGIGQFSSTFGNSITFGRDPNSLTNARGELPNDRTHMFRTMGSIEIPKVRFTIASNFQYLSGLPWAATASVSLPQGLQRILLEQRGTRRLSPQKLWDLRVSKSLQIAESARIELLADVLNVLNSSAEEGLVDDNLFSQNFSRPNVFVDPRRAMMGIRFVFGR